MIRKESRYEFLAVRDVDRAAGMIPDRTTPDGLWAVCKVVRMMDTKDMLLKLRTEHGLSQEMLAERLYVTRQAVSRWEQGETIPNTETLKRLSKLFDVSINTLLGAPRQLICQCCGMPLDDSTLSREPDGTFNEDYCKWCYTGGAFTYADPEELIRFCVEHMSSEQWPPEQIRAYMEALLPKLSHWKQPDASRE